MDRRKNNNSRREPPFNATAAVQQLIRVTQKLVDLSERETKALLQRDMLAFSILQDEKESVTGQYMKASEEFRNRIEDFRGVEKTLIGRLEMLQRTLSEKSVGNNVMVEQMQRHAQNNTHRTLLMAQEFGQQKRIHSNQNHNEGGY